MAPIPIIHEVNDKPSSETQKILDTGEGYGPCLGPSWRLIWNSELGMAEEVFN